MGNHSFFICDPQDITRLGFIAVLQSTDSNERIESINTKEILIGKLSAGTPAIVIIDFGLFEINELNELAVIQESFPKTEWIFISNEVEVEFIHQLSQLLPTASYVLKTDPLDDLLAAVDSGLHHKRHYSNQVLEVILGQLQPAKLHPAEAAPFLTPTEREIVSLLVAGKTTKEIAASRCLSYHTVGTHRKNIFRKMEVNSVQDLTKKALKLGLIDYTEYYI